MTKNHLCVYPINWADQLNLLWGNMNGAQRCHLLPPLNELCKHFYDYLVFFMFLFSFINLATLYPTAYTAYSQKHADTSRRGSMRTNDSMLRTFFCRFFIPARHVYHMCRYLDTESSTTRIYILRHPQIMMPLLIYYFFVLMKYSYVHPLASCSLRQDENLDPAARPFFRWVCFVFFF